MVQIVTDPSVTRFSDSKNMASLQKSNPISEVLALAERAPNIEAKIDQFARALNISRQDFPAEKTKVISVILDFCETFSDGRIPDLLIEIEASCGCSIESTLDTEPEIRHLRAKYTRLRNRTRKPLLTLAANPVNEDIPVGDIALAKEK